MSCFNAFLVDIVVRMPRLTYMPSHPRCTLFPVSLHTVQYESIAAIYGITNATQ